MQPRLPGIIRKDKHPSRSEGKEPLQVRIPVIVKRRFKTQAAIRGIEPNQLFVEIWDHYEKTVIAASNQTGE
jgi:hypothetical protein